MLVYFPNITFLYALMFALILLNLYFTVILFSSITFPFMNQLCLAKDLFLIVDFEDEQIQKFLLSIFIQLVISIIFPFEKIMLWFFFSFLDFFVFSLTSSNNFSSFTLLIISIGECFLWLWYIKKLAIECSKLNLFFWASLASMRNFCTVLLNASIAPCDWGCTGVPFTK